MAKAKKKEQQKNVLLMVLAVAVIALLVAVTLMLDQRDDELTSWATIKSTELRLFFNDCRSTGGVLDVRPNAAPSIVFICGYSDRMVEYTLETPGR